MFASVPRSSSQLAVGHPAVGDAPEDAALVAAARADPRAFAPLYERYVGPVYRYCYLRMGTRETAEDVTSEVFLKALAGLSSFHGGVFGAWLFRIARNSVADAHRRHRPSQPMGEAVDPIDPSLTPEEVALAWDEVSTLRAAMIQLPGDQQTVLELTLAGWTGERIAAALQRSPDAVKMLRYRATSRLRTLLNSVGRNPGEGCYERA